MYLRFLFLPVLILTTPYVVGCATSGPSDAYQSAVRDLRERDRQFREELEERFAPSHEWEPQCSYNVARDLRSCTFIVGVRAAGVTLNMSVYGRGKALFSLGVDHHPGESSVIRVDSNPPVYAADEIRGYFNASQSAALVEQMKRGSVAYFSSTRWPNRSFQNKVPLDGFTAGYEKAVQWLRENS
jgi:hypothetical protein